MDPPRTLVTFVARADNRVEVLDALASDRATRPDLQEATGIPRTTLSRIIADFRERGLVERDGHEYAATPLGELIATELDALFDAVEAMGRLAAVREWLDVESFDFPIGRLADADVVLPTASDPTAPIRRAETLLSGARQVRLVANSVVPGCLEAVWDAVTDGRQTVEWVTTPAALEVLTADPELIRWTRDVLEPPVASGYVHREGFPQAVFVVDGTVFTPVKDDTGTVQGHVETDDEAIRTWAEATIDRYVTEAEPLSVETLPR